MRGNLFNAKRETFGRKSKRIALLLCLFVSTALAACGGGHVLSVPSHLGPDYRPSDYAAAVARLEAERAEAEARAAPPPQGGLVRLLGSRISGPYIGTRSSSNGGGFIELKGGSARLPNRWEGFDGGGQGWSYKNHIINP